MVDLNPRLGEMDVENGAFLQSAMEGSRDHHLIKLLEGPIVMDRSLLATALSFWSSMTNTLSLPFNMMTLTVLDMATTLTAQRPKGSFKVAWPTVARLTTGKVKNMLNYSSFYHSFSVEDDA